MARFAPLGEARAVACDCRFEFQEETGEQVVFRFEHTDPLGEPANLFSPLGRQF